MREREVELEGNQTGTQREHAECLGRDLIAGVAETEVSHGEGSECSSAESRKRAKEGEQRRRVAEVELVVAVEKRAGFLVDLLAY